MLALWLDSQRLTLRDDVPPPAPPAGEAIVRVLRAGICATDHGLVAGLYPFRGVLGHEFVGVVERGPEALVGRRVVGEINAACGACERCAQGLGRHCARRTVLGIVGRDGAFAEHLALPAGNLLEVPDEVSTAEAVFTEPLAAALEVVEQVRVLPTHRVLVVGDGRLGQLVAQVLALTGCDLVVAGRHERKRRLLEARGIATAAPGDVPQADFDVAVECSGGEGGFAAARRALRPRGTLVLKSTYPGAPRIDTTMLVVDEVTVVGSRCGPFAPALRLLRDRKVDVACLEDASFPLERGLEAFETSRQRDLLKVTLSMEGS